MMRELNGNRIERVRWTKVAVRMASQQACETIHQAGESMLAMFPTALQSRGKPALHFKVLLPRDMPPMEQWRCFGCFGPACHPVAVAEDALEWLACYDESIAGGRNPMFGMR